MPRFLALVFCWFVFAACEQLPHELYIDSACTPEHRQLIKDGIANLNDWVEYYTAEESIEYLGIKKYNHDHFQDGIVSDSATVVCFYERPEKYPEGNWYGWSDGLDGDIYLFFFQTAMNEKQRVRSAIAHELGHHIGLHHSPDESAVMFRNSRGVWEYTDADTALLCAERDCPTFSVCD